MSTHAHGSNRIRAANNWPMTFDRSFAYSPIPYLILFAWNLACAGEPATAVRVLTELDTGKSFQVRVGSEISVRLPSRLGTGYGWQVVHRDRSCLAEIEPPRVQRDREAKPGEGELQIFRFRAMNPCNTRLELRYVRPWWPPSTGARSGTLRR